ncbi:spermine/spermidine N-acetyltransferase [Psychrobacillus sp. OK028]|uniref:GNAT family N-acetyltransferase n=1 Tax=Psychrobacillus sp. OK028 TaxID=1884359 RepID=UPI00088187F1|nr:GNAT family N-acetyltransferase [Psychrobacillus sp. OK028]SDN50378.1 spermine/spermidine N-acetyltransferase [Psychrobacillus sp. OK028]
MTITIRQCTSENLHQLQQIGRQTFYETFHEHNKMEDMKAYLAKAFTEEKLLSELLNPNSEFFVAYVDGAIAAYLKLNVGDAQTEQMEDRDLEIERIYILQEFQKSGLGKQLYQKAVERAQTLEKQRIWLGVWEKNENALAFYEKMGFTRFGEHSFFMGDDEQMDFILVKSIEA